MLPTSYKQLAIAGLAIGALGGCNLAGEPGGTRTYSNPDVPFTFRVPDDFTNAAIDQGDTRGAVVAATGLTKLDVIAVRRLGSGSPPAGIVAHRVEGHAVVSEVHRVYGGGWALECQYTSERATKVRAACRQAIATVRRR